MARPLGTTSTHSAGNAGGANLNRTLMLVAVAYIVAVAGLLLLWHVALTPDLLLLLLVPIGIASRRFGTWVADWLPFVVLLVGWEAMRAFAGVVGAHAHNAGLRLDRILFFGQVPTVVLQHALDHGAGGRVLGAVLSQAYIAHFGATVAIGLVLWIGDRRMFRRYVVALISMAFAAFVVYLAFPTAPPWFDADHGFIPPIHRIVVESLPTYLGPWYSALDPNQFAALPSMHAAFPFLGYLAVRRWNRRASWVVLAWTVLIWFAVVYLGEHYVSDVLAGAVFAYGAWWATTRLADRRTVAGQAHLVAAT